MAHLSCTTEHDNQAPLLGYIVKTSQESPQVQRDMNFKISWGEAALEAALNTNVLPPLSAVYYRVLYSIQAHTHTHTHTEDPHLCNVYTHMYTEDPICTLGILYVHYGSYIRDPVCTLGIMSVHYGSYIRDPVCTLGILD